MTQGLIDSYWRKYNQRRALTGLPSSYQEQRGMLDPMMESAANKDIQEAQLRYQNERSNQDMALRQQQAKDSKRAANVSGATNLVGIGVQGALGWKYLNKPAAAPPAAAPPASATTGGYADGNIGTGPSFSEAPGAGSGGTGILSGAGSGTTPAASTPSYTPMTDAQMAYDTGGASGGYSGQGAGSGDTGGTAGFSGGSGVGVLGGAAAGLATNYLVTQTGEGKASNARVADWSRYAGMTNLSDQQYADKGSATVGGLAGSGPVGAAIAPTVYDIQNIIKTGTVSNELIGIPYADKVFNTNINSIFGS